MDVYWFTSSSVSPYIAKLKLNPGEGSAAEKNNTNCKIQFFITQAECHGYCYARKTLNYYNFLTCDSDKMNNYV